ncbi:MAG: hydrogenase [Gammaproteobacteria bacterium]|nr:MAG: hydrogenase [Gammaproteobacteria bacterium]
MDDSRRRLLWHGMFLFLLGLVTGLVETRFSNTRMGLAAHLEGVMNGIFLLALGAVWAEVQLNTRLKGVTYWSVLYGTYANWVFTTLAAVFGTGALSPITAPGLTAAPWQENLIHVGFMSVGLATAS